MKALLAGGAGVLALIVGVTLLAAMGASLAQAGALNPAGIPAAFVPWIVRAAGGCRQVSAPLLAAQLYQESGFNPTAVSPVGALGLAQFMPGTWPQWGRDDAGDGNVSPLNPPDAIMAAARYDCALAAQVAGVPGDQVANMLAAYNAGPGAVLAAGGVPPIAETQGYVQAIKALIGRFTLVTAPGGGAAGAFAAAEIQAAMRYRGLPYVWGGGDAAGPTGGGFDCSGLVLYAVAQASGGRITLPHSSELQATMGAPVDPSQMRPGDVIAFALHGGGDFDHVGIYIGGGAMVEAPHTGDVVKVASLADPYWQRAPQVVRRFG